MAIHGKRAVIKDDKVRVDLTYSSKQIEDRLATKSDITHTHSIKDLSDVNGGMNPTINQVLTWNGTQWTSQDPSGGGSTSPGGSDMSIQYNNGGNFAGDSNLVWDYTNNRLGINTSSPSYVLDIYPGDGSELFMNAGSVLDELTLTGASGKLSSFAFRYTGAGDNGVRFTKYADSVKNWIIGFDDGDNAFQIKQGWGGSPRVNSYVNSWIYIKSTGEVGIGTTNPTKKLQVGESGDGTVALANSWDTFSDKKIKKNIQDLTFNATDIVVNLRPVSFEFVRDTSNQTHYGLIAQEVKQHLPEIVHRDKNSDIYTLSYTELIPILIKAIQELHARLEQLENGG